MTHTGSRGRWDGSRPLTIGEVLRLPATVDLTTAGRALGFGRTKAYAMLREDRFPCRLVRIGETYRVPTADILALLGIDVASVAAEQRRSKEPTRPAAGDRDA